MKKVVALALVFVMMVITMGCSVSSGVLVDEVEASLQTDDPELDFVIAASAADAEYTFRYETKTLMLYSIRYEGKADQSLNVKSLTVTAEGVADEVLQDASQMETVMEKMSDPSAYDSLHVGETMAVTCVQLAESLIAALAGEADVDCTALFTSAKAIEVNGWTINVTAEEGVCTISAVFADNK